MTIKENTQLSIYDFLEQEVEVNDPEKTYDDHESNDQKTLDTKEYAALLGNFVGADSNKVYEYIKKNSIDEIYAFPDKFQKELKLSKESNEKLRSLDKLGKLQNQLSGEVDRYAITSSLAAVNFCRNLYSSSSEQEDLFALSLNTKNEVISADHVFRGGLNSSIAHPREILSKALANRAARIIITHNHPSQNPEPSEADLMFTKRMSEAAEIMGIPLLDHIVIGNNELSANENDYRPNKDYVSFKEAGYLDGRNSNGRIAEEHTGYGIQEESVDYEKLFKEQTNLGYAPILADKEYTIPHEDLQKLDNALTVALDRIYDTTFDLSDVKTARWAIEELQGAKELTEAFREMSYSGYMEESNTSFLVMMDSVANGLDFVYRDMELGTSAEAESAKNIVCSIHEKTDFIAADELNPFTRSNIGALTSESKEPNQERAVSMLIDNRDMFPLYDFEAATTQDILDDFPGLKVYKHEDSEMLVFEQIDNFSELNYTGIVVLRPQDDQLNKSLLPFHVHESHYKQLLNIVDPEDISGGHDFLNEVRSDFPSWKNEVYWYELQNRGISPGAFPRNPVAVEHAHVNDKGFDFGAVAYAEPLEAEDIDGYELKPLDRHVRELMGYEQDLCDAAKEEIMAAHVPSIEDNEIEL